MDDFHFHDGLLDFYTESDRIHIVYVILKKMRKKITIITVISRKKRE